MALPPLNFPASPAINDLYPIPPVTGQPTYIWDGNDWVSQFPLGQPYVPLNGSQPMSGLLTLSGDPTAVLGAVTKQYSDAAIAATVTALLPQGYLFGLTMSTAGVSTTLSVAAGAACDSTGARILKLAAALAKTTAAWVAGSGTGGLDTGAIAASTWYHWYLIFNPTTNAVDVVFSATASPANGPTTMPAGFTLFRRIGSMLTNASSQWVFFHQLGDEFLFDNTFAAATSLAIGDALAHPLTLTTPPSLQVWALIIGNVGGSPGVDARCYISSLDKLDEVVSPGNMNAGTYLITANSTSIPFALTVRTSTGSQIRYRAIGAGATLSLNVAGWIDTRGRLY